MRYKWEITFGSHIVEVRAGAVHTALTRAIDVLGRKEVDVKKLKEGQINFKRLGLVQRVRCRICNNTYEEGDKWAEELHQHKPRGN
jgi:hypothetical protein